MLEKNLGAHESFRDPVPPRQIPRAEQRHRRGSSIFRPSVLAQKAPLRRCPLAAPSLPPDPSLPGPVRRPARFRRGALGAVKSKFLAESSLICFTAIP